MIREVFAIDTPGVSGNLHKFKRQYYVDRFKDLPNVKKSKGKLVKVRNRSGILMINFRLNGDYISDGINWLFIQGTNK